MGYRRTGKIQEPHPQLFERRPHGLGGVRPRQYALPHSDPASADSIPKWIDFVREAGKKDIHVYLIGNKSDLDSDISPDIRHSAVELAEQQAEHYQEVSAKTAHNIEDMFTRIIDDLVSSSTKKKEGENAASVIAEGDKKEDQQVGNIIKLNSKKSKGQQG